MYVSVYVHSVSRSRQCVVVTLSTCLIEVPSLNLKRPGGNPYRRFCSFLQCLACECWNFDASVAEMGTPPRGLNVSVRGPQIFVKCSSRHKILGVRKGDTRQLRYWVPSSIRRHSTECSRPGDLAAGIREPLVSFICSANTALANLRTQSASVLQLC